MQLAITFFTVVSGLILSLVVAVLALELIFGQMMRLFFVRRTIAVKTERNR